MLSHPAGFASNCAVAPIARAASVLKNSPKPPSAERSAGVQLGGCGNPHGDPGKQLAKLTMSRNSLRKNVAENFTRSLASIWSTPALNVLLRSGFKSGLPGKHGSASKDWAKFGSLIPRP